MIIMIINNSSMCVLIGAPRCDRTTVRLEVQASKSNNYLSQASLVT